MRIQSADMGGIPASTQPTGAAHPEIVQADSRPAPQPAVGERLSPAAAQGLVKEMNHALQSINTGLQFSLEDQTGEMVVKVIDLETKETLRQFPSEEAIAIARALDKLKGVLLRQTA